MLVLVLLARKAAAAAFKPQQEQLFCGGVQDANGCCPPYYYCGSNGRCTHTLDACEDPLGELARCGGRVGDSSFDLSGLQITSGPDREISLNDSTLIFNLCSNVRTPAGCEASGIAYETQNGSCSRVAGSAYTTPMVLRAHPKLGVVVSYGGGDDCRFIEVSIACNPSAIEPTRVFVDDDGGCRVRVSFESAFGCPTECALSNGLPCSGRGDCVWGPFGVPRCDCDRDYAGIACDVRPTTANIDFPFAAWVWQAAAALLVSLAGAAGIALRCRAIRKARAAEIDAHRTRRYRSLATKPQDDPEEGLELHESFFVSTTTTNK